nr:hypothetical protein [Tanacetum cinerariifolium]
MWRRSGGNVMRTLRRASGISILSFGIIPGTLPEPLKIGKTGQRARCRPQPLRSTRSSLTNSSWHTLLMGNSFGMRTDEEIRRLEAMDTYTDDEISRLARRQKQRGHIAGVGRYCRHGPQQPNGSGGCGDEEEGADHQDDEDEDGDGDT